MNSCSRFVFSIYCNQLILGKNRGLSQTCHLQKGNTCKSLCLLLKRKPLKTFSHRAGFAIMSASDPPVYKQVRTSWAGCILCSTNLPDRKENHEQNTIWHCLHWDFSMFFFELHRHISGARDLARMSMLAWDRTDKNVAKGQSPWNEKGFPLFLLNTSTGIYWWAAKGISLWLSFLGMSTRDIKWRTGRLRGKESIINVTRRKI